MAWAAETLAVAAGKQAKVGGWLGMAVVLGAMAVAGWVQLNTVAMGVFVVEVEPGTDTVGAVPGR